MIIENRLFRCTADRRVGGRQTPSDKLLFGIGKRECEVFCMIVSAEESLSSFHVLIRSVCEGSE